MDRRRFLIQVQNIREAHGLDAKPYCAAGMALRKATDAQRFARKHGSWLTKDERFMLKK